MGNIFRKNLQRLYLIPEKSTTLVLQSRRICNTCIINTYYSGIKIFNNLPSSLKSLTNEKAEFKVALKRYLNTHSFYSVDKFLLSKNDSSF
jgi:hypothetical protein